MTTSLTTVFQLIALLLSAAHNNPQATPAMLQEITAISNRAVQIDAQMKAAPKITFNVPKNSSVWPGSDDLYHSAYLDPQGNYTQLATGVALVGSDTSFGDLNGDGFDDAAAIVQRTDDAGTTTIALAAMLNQGGVMFNIADLTLGKNVQMFDHHVVDGVVVLDMQVDNQPRALVKYQLVGKEWMKI
jgi:hypothetical protein